LGLLGIEFHCFFLFVFYGDIRSHILVMGLTVNPSLLRLICLFDLTNVVAYFFYYIIKVIKFIGSIQVNDLTLKFFLPYKNTIA
jgi:hypothetical protein